MTQMIADNEECWQMDLSAETRTSSTSWRVMRRIAKISLSSSLSDFSIEHPHRDEMCPASEGSIPTGC